MRLKNVILLTLFLSGCSSLGIFHSSPDDEESVEENSGDPITSAALALRSKQMGTSSKNLRSAEEKNLNPELIQKSMNTYELALGMSRHDVISAWGKPQDILWAGERHLGHEKWIYLNSASTQSKVHQPKVVYFESGRVIGWEKNST